MGCYHRKQMSRQPDQPFPAFQPDVGTSLPGTPSAGRPAAADTITVSQLAEQIRAALTIGVDAPVRVIGQVSNLSDRTHWFFSLKDESAAIRCVCFASTARKIRFPVKDGLEVVATGRVDFYNQQGHVQLYVDKLEPVGVGELELRYRALCEKLRSAGYFEPARKKPLPLLPRKVAVVTSRSAAALQDVINTAAKRWPGCELLLCDVRVQGEAAAPEIANVISDLSRRGPKLGIDAIIVTRGGGSIEDLWAFNEKAVADAIFKCPIPIAAAIGHETDTTIAELVADVRCATPTQAAMAVIPDARAMRHQLDQNQRRLDLLISRMMQHQRQRLDSAARFALFRRPETYLQPYKNGIAQLNERLQLSLPQRLNHERRQLAATGRHLAAVSPTDLSPHQRALSQTARQLDQAMSRTVLTTHKQIDALARQLEAVSPKQVLSRGYSYTLSPDGHVLTDARKVRPGDPITTVLAHGRLKSHVAEQDGSPTAEPAADASRTEKKRSASPDKKQAGRKKTTRRTKKKPRAVEANQMDLFGGE